MATDHRGAMLVLVLAFGAVAIIMIVGGISSYTIFEHRSSLRVHERDAALYLAEAGIEYYRWHLKADPDDFTDGTGGAEPYVHEYTDKNGETIGYFSLDIEKPGDGASGEEDDDDDDDDDEEEEDGGGSSEWNPGVIRSTGWSIRHPEIKKTVETNIVSPGAVQEVILSGANLDLSNTTVIHGGVRANGGIRFYATTDALVQSATSSYLFENQSQNGIWGDGGPQSFWEFPVAFANVTGTLPDLEELKEEAEDDGLYFAASGQLGWHLIISTTSVRAYKVSAKNCYQGENSWKGDSGSYWPRNSSFCYDIRTEAFQNTFPLPENGVIFVADHLWVNGTAGPSVTIAAGTLPASSSTYKDIIIPSNFAYDNAGSSSTIGIVAQRNVLVPYNAPNAMTIHGALVAENGVISRPPYRADTKASLTFLGAQVSLKEIDWEYQNGFGNIVSGFLTVSMNFDSDIGELVPIGFPRSEEYTMAGWNEL